MTKNIAKIIGKLLLGIASVAALGIGAALGKMNGAGKRDGNFIDGIGTLIAGIIIMVVGFAVKKLFVGLTKGVGFVAKKTLKAVKNIGQKLKNPASNFCQKILNGLGLRKAKVIEFSAHRPDFNLEQSQQAQSQRYKQTQPVRQGQVIESESVKHSQRLWPRVTPGSFSSGKDNQQKHQKNNKFAINKKPSYKSERMDY